MELEQDFATIKKFLKYLPRHLKSKSLPRLEETNKSKKAAKTEENLSRNELRDKLKQKILELRQKTKKKVRDDSNGTLVNKKIKKERPQKPERNTRLAQAQKGEGKIERGRNKSKDNKPNGKPKAKSQTPKGNKKTK